MQRTLNEHQGKFSFSSFVPCFTLKLVLCFSWKLHVFLSLLHLSTSSYKRERGLMSFKNNLQTHITPNFTQMHIFQLVLFPICICIILNHLSPKICTFKGNWDEICEIMEFISNVCIGPMNKFLHFAEFRSMATICVCVGVSRYKLLSLPTTWVVRSTPPSNGKGSDIFYSPWTQTWGRLWWSS